MTRVAALYVDPKGVYAGLPDVDVWDEARDARLYEGPWPVVAHPPCTRWSILGGCHGYRDGEDGGCFEAALAAVREFGGVLEHPAHTLAWRRFGLPEPSRLGWTTSLTDCGVTTWVDQAAYGHEARKQTWLYFVGASPPALRWLERGNPTTTVQNGGSAANPQRRSATPPAFRDVLLNMARSAAKVPA